MDDQQSDALANSPRPSPFQFGLGSILILSVVICLQLSVEQYYPGGSFYVSAALAYGSGGLLIALAIASGFLPRARQILHRLAPWSGLLWASLFVVYAMLASVGRVKVD